MYEEIFDNSISDWEKSEFRVVSMNWLLGDIKSPIKISSKTCASSNTGLTKICNSLGEDNG